MNGISIRKNEISYDTLISLLMFEPSLLFTFLVSNQFPQYFPQFWECNIKIISYLIKL